MDTAETSAWAGKNHACWELQPLVEMHHGERLQVGYELDLYARVPMDIAPSEERRTAVLAIWDRLRDIAESLLPADSRLARLEVEPFDAAARLRPETRFVPEVLLKVRLFHASDYFAPVTEDDRARLHPLEERLRELGLRARNW